jgi:hypothetical protein
MRLMNELVNPIVLFDSRGEVYMKENTSIMFREKFSETYFIFLILDMSKIILI